MTVPTFRQVCQLTGDIAESPITKMLDTADEISGQAAEVERLRAENAELRARVDELTAEVAWAAEVGPGALPLTTERAPGHPHLSE